MEKTIAVVALCIAIGGLAVVGSVVAANGFAIPRSVIGGGGQEASGGGMVLNGTIAEPIASDLQVGPAYGLRAPGSGSRPKPEPYKGIANDLLVPQ